MGTVTISLATTVSARRATARTGPTHSPTGPRPPPTS